MTRTITTADLAPLVTRHGADFETSKWTVELGFPASEPVSIHSWEADLLAAIPSAPVVPAHVCTGHCGHGQGHYPAPTAPVVSDAAVEAAARARTPYVFMDLRSPFRAHGESRSDAELREAERARECAKMRDALTAALPLLGAAPSATREDVRDEIAGHPIGSGYYANSVSVDEAAEIADALLDRFTITPRTDR